MSVRSVFPATIDARVNPIATIPVVMPVLMALCGAV
jgi:hypothetical protein